MKSVEHNDPSYLPTPEDIRNRAEALQWMQRMGWSWDTIDAIMYRDDPNLETLRDMVYRMGPDATLAAIEGML